MIIWDLISKLDKKEALTEQDQEFLAEALRNYIDNANNSYKRITQLKNELYLASRGEYPR